MRLLALDIASIVGCCDGPIEGEARLWTWHLRDLGDPRPLRFLTLAKLLRQYFAEEQCDGVVYEAPLAVGPLFERGASAHVITSLIGMVGVVELVCAEHGKPVESLYVQSARSSVLGWARNANKRERTKDRVLREVTKLFKIPAENEHEADAWVLWAHAGARANPRLAVALTPLFREKAG